MKEKIMKKLDAKEKVFIISFYVSVIKTISRPSITIPNPNWPQIPNHQYKILIIGGSGSGKMDYLI